MATGFLSVEPIVPREGPDVGTITVSVTDESGTRMREARETSTYYELPAPEAGYSLDPDSAVRPYSRYTVDVSTQGPYESVRFTGVQIFDGIESLLPVELVEGTGERVIEIPEHQLWELNGDTEKLTLEEMPMVRVLRNVVLPETLVVHLGRPTAVARNVQVTFVNYIKNVACSEIYPTWPENALRANIYAQISLVLNRIYTEWYRSRGYDFDITNSTQFDQYFVDGRNIFENVAAICDEIFDRYVRRTGDAAPYYAEYCNGTTATCPGMSQWGTVDLSNRGYTPINILRYYYGNSIELAVAGIVPTTPVSYPGTPLRRGSTGSDVTTIQNQLNRIRQNYPSIPAINPVDGIFGAQTEAAVRRFQTLFGLTVDGVVGQSTWNRISYIYVSVRKLAELGSEGEPITVDDGTYPGYALRYGDRGDNVRKIQRWLTVLSLYYNRIFALNEDGIFGYATREDVIIFQERFYLVPDGVVGRATWQLLYDVYFFLTTGTVSDDEILVELPTPEYPGSPLRTGSSGIYVRLVQYYLNALNRTYPSIPIVQTDGVYGSLTAASVRAFQNAVGITADGVVGPVTWEQLTSQYSGNVSDTAYLSAYPIPLTAYPGEITTGSSGSSVALVQGYINRLAELGYYGLGSVPVDGIYGTQTKNEIIGYQTERQLPVSGNVDEATWQRLQEDYYGTFSRPFDPAPPLAATLRIGSTGEAVTQLQKWLSALSGIYRELTPLGIDGIYGSKTAQTVRDFQRLFGLAVDGVTGAETWQAVYDVYSTVRTQDAQTDSVPPVIGRAPSFTETPGSEVTGEAQTQKNEPVYETPGGGATEVSFTGTLRRGDRGNEVRRLQRYLNVAAEAKLEEDGIFGDKTMRAAAEFARRNALKADGTADAAMRLRLYDEYKKRI